MENNKGVTWFLVGLALLIVGWGAVCSLIAGDWSPIWLTLGIVALGAVGTAVIALLFAIEIGPLVWLLSRLARRKKNPPASPDEHPDHRRCG